MAYQNTTMAPGCKRNGATGATLCTHCGEVAPDGERYCDPACADAHAVHGTYRPGDSGGDLWRDVRAASRGAF